MDSIKINIFLPILFTVTVINSSVNLLLDNSEDKEENKQRTIQQYDSELLMKHRSIHKMINRIRLFLKIRQQKPVYLIWLTIDFCLGFYLLFDLMVYGFGSDSLILRLEGLNLTLNLFAYYTYFRMVSKILAVLLMETYYMRLRNISRCMSLRHRHRNYDVSATYLACLNLTLRAWLYIMGLIKVVESRDKVYREKIKYSNHLESNISKIVTRDSKNSKGSENKIIFMQRHLIEVKQKGPFLGRRYNYHFCDFCSKSAYSNTNDLEETNYEKELFDFNDDFREINYQLKFPKILLKNGTPHIMDLKTLRFLLFWFLASLLAVVVGDVLLARASFLVEYHGCHNSMKIFLGHRVVPYGLAVIATSICVHQMTDIGKFILECLVCYTKAKHTLNFALHITKLYWYHRKQTTTTFGTPSTYETKCKNYNNNVDYNYEVSPLVAGKTAINCDRIDKKVINVTYFRQSMTNRMLDKERKNLIDLSRNIDKLIRMISELRSEFDQLKLHFTVYLNLEIICKMPCIMLTLATLMIISDLDYLQLQAIHLVFVGYWLPVILATYTAALIHHKVNMIC